MHKSETRKVLHDCHSLTSGIFQMIEALSSTESFDPSDLNLLIKYSEDLTLKLKNLSSLTTLSSSSDFPAIDLAKENTQAEITKTTLFTTHTYYSTGWLRNPFYKNETCSFDKGWDETCKPSFLKWMEVNYYPNFPEYYTLVQAKEDLDSIRPRVDDRDKTVAYRIDGELVGILLFDNNQDILTNVRSTHIRFAFVDVEDQALRDSIKSDMIDTINSSTSTPGFTAFIGHYNIASQKFFSKLGLIPVATSTAKK